MLFPADLLPRAGAPVLPPAPRTGPPTSPAALSWATVLHLDAAGVWDAVTRVLPDGARPESAAHAHLTSFANVRSLVANPEWLLTGHRTDLAVDPRGVTPLRTGLTIQGRAGASQFVGETDLVIGDINFTMVADAVTFGRQVGGDAGGSLRGGLDLGADTDVAGEPVGDAAGGLRGSRSWFNAESHTSTRIYGRERLRIHTSGTEKQYVYRMPVDLEITGVEHHPKALGGTRTAHESLPARDVVYAIPERVALELHVAGEHPVPADMIADALHRYSTGHLTLDRKVVTGLLDRYGTPPDLATGIAWKLGEQFPDASVPRTVTDPAARISAIIRQEQGLPAVPPAEGALRLADHLGRALGHSVLEPAIRLSARDGRPVELFQEVLARVEQVVPGAAERLPGLWQGLSGSLAGKRWTGQLDNMLSPEGFTASFPVPSGRLWVEHVTVRITATLGGGTPIGTRPDVLPILQDYAYAQHEQTRVSGYGYGTGGSGHGTALDTPEASGGTNRGYTRSGTVGGQRTVVQGLMITDGVVRMRRPIEIHIEVSRSVPHPLKQLPRRMADLVTRHGASDSSFGVVSGSLVQLATKDQLVPRSSAVVDGPADPRQLPMPDRSVVETADIGRLHEVISDRLAGKDMLGRAGLAVRDADLRRQLSALAHTPALERVAGPGGHPSITLSDPARENRMVQVWVRAEQSQLRVTAEIEVAEIRRVNRSQRTVGIGDERARLALTGRTLAEDQKSLGGLSERFTGGAAATEQTSAPSGARMETSDFQESSARTVTTRVDYHLTFVAKTVGPGGRETIEVSAQMPDAASGQAVLTLFQHELDAIRAGQEAGAGTSPQWRFDPRGSTETALIKLSTTASRHPDAADPITAALQLAQVRRADVLLDVTEADGTVRRYRAAPDGTLQTDFPDTGFATARASVDPALVEQAHRHGLNLREEFQQWARHPDGHRTFSDAIRAALTDPAAELRGIDSELGGWAPRPADPSRPTAAQIPGDVRTSVDAVAAGLPRSDPRLGDLQVIRAAADNVEDLAAAARHSGDLTPLKEALRDLSDRIRAFGDELADPLDPAGLARRVFGVDPATHRFHVLDQAVAVVLAEKVLGPRFAARYAEELSRAVPMDGEHAAAVLGERGRRVAAAMLEQVAPGVHRYAGYSERAGAVFLRPGTPFVEAAASVVHETEHAMQPSREAQRRAAFEGLADNATAADQEAALAKVTIDRERPAHERQRDFLLGLERLTSADNAELAPRARWLTDGSDLDAGLAARYLHPEPNGPELISAVFGPDRITPADLFWHELSDRVAEVAERRGTTAEQELRQFVLQRVMARVFTTHPEHWMIKGGQTLLARWPDARVTSDIDLVGHTGASRAEMVRQYTEALQRSLGDHLTFTQTYEAPLQHGMGARLKHDAYFNGRFVAEVSVDLAPPRSRPMWAQPELVDFPEHIMRTGVPGRARSCGSSRSPTPSPTRCPACSPRASRPRRPSAATACPARRGRGRARRGTCRIGCRTSSTRCCWS
ncbi:hypothetical protein [Dactylosporangium cerinum]